MPPTPVITSIAALLAIAYSAWRFTQLQPHLRQLRQGIDGEKIVGQYLEGLRSGGYRVFHDVVGSNFNIDHVVIGPEGAFTVETKTWSKPLRGPATITVEDGRLLANGRSIDRDPIVQARAQASWLRNILQESTGKSIYVHPVVVFPNWFVEQPSERLKGIWILEPKALPAFLKHEPERLESSDVALAASHLSRFIRSEEQRRRGRV